MELKIDEENIEENICFVSTLEKHLQSNQYQDLFFEIHHIRNFDFGFFIKNMTIQTVYLNNLARKSGVRSQFLRKSDF